MKCQGVLEGKVCGASIPENEPYCPSCKTPSTPVATLSCPCGTVVRTDHNFCLNCDQSVQQIKGQAECSPNLCSGKLDDGTVCGYKLIQGLNFCPRCGTRRGVGQQPSLAACGLESTAKDPGSHTSSAAMSSLTESQSTVAAEALSASGGSDQLPQFFSQYADMTMTGDAASITEETKKELDTKQQSTDIVQDAGVVKTPISVSDADTTNTYIAESVRTKSASDINTESEKTWEEKSSGSTSKDEDPGAKGAASTDTEIANTPESQKQEKECSRNVTEHPLMEEVGNQRNPDPGKTDCRSSDTKTDEGPTESEKERKERRNEKERVGEITSMEDMAQSGTKTSETDCENNNGSNVGGKADGRKEKKVKGEGGKATTGSSAKQMDYAGALKGGACKQQNKNSGAGANTKGNALLSSEDKLAVVFHIIMSEKFKMNKDKDIVCIRFEPKLLGGFSPDMDRHHLSFVRDTEIGPMFEGKVVMTRDLRNKGFQYKYVVRRKDVDRPEWEYVLKRKKYDYTKQVIVNRKFDMPAQDRACSGDWHRYDGVAYPKMKDKDSFVHTLSSTVKYWFGAKTFENKIQSEAVAAGKEFLPSAEDIIQTLKTAEEGGSGQKGKAEELLNTINTMMCSLKLQMLNDKLDAEDPQLASTCVRVNLVMPLLEMLDEAIKKGRRTVALAMFVWRLVTQHNVHVSPASIGVLCRAMLIIPDMDNRLCPDITDLETQFPVGMKDRSSLAELVLMLINRSSDLKDDPCWWCCIPIIHFLDGTSSPFQPLDPSFEIHNDSWWGVMNIITRKNRFKNQVMEATGKLMDHIELMQNAFAADAMLCRSVVASLELAPLLPVLLKAPVTVETCAATLIYHLKFRSFYEEGMKQLLGEVVRKMKATLMQQSHRTEPDQNLKLVRVQSFILEELMKVVFSNTRHFEDYVQLDMIHLLFVALDQWAALEHTVCEIKGVSTTQEWKPKAMDAVNTTCDSLRKTHKLHLLNYEREKKLPEHLKMWGQLFKTTEDLKYAPLKQLLEKSITQQFENTVNKLPADDKLEVFLNQMDQVVPAFMHILNRLAFDSLEEAFKQGSSYVEENNIRLVSLMSSLLEKKYREITKNTDIFTFVINWVTMDNYLKRFDNQQSMESLTEAARGIIEESISSIRSTQQCLVDGTIPVVRLRFVLYKHERFLAVMVATGHQRQHIQEMLALRGCELQAFTRASDRIKKLFEHCTSFLGTGDFEQVRDSIQQKFAERSLKEVVQVSQLGSVKNLNLYKPVTNPWRLPHQVLSVLPDFEQRISCLIFRKMLTQAGEKMDLTKVTFWQAFQSLWEEVNMDWTALCDRMKDGSISLKETDKLFRIYSGDCRTYNYTEMEKDLCHMSLGGATDWVKERIDQFICYTNIKQHVDAASTLLRFSEAYNISGNFTIMEKICSLSKNAMQPIRDVDQSILGLCEQLQEVSTQDVICLRGLVSPRGIDLVKWLKKNMTGGLKELNVFVDLAFISAGEESMSIDRVNCFHAVATGYAPLIFSTIEGGSEELLQRCRLVFNNIRADPKLPRKLEDIGHCLGWFKDVQKSHGSVEKTSLSQVANINARGVFRLSRKPNKAPALDNVVHLRVCEDEASNNPARTYSFEELLDLQSRLMLVAGQLEKRKENVDRFITIMENLMRLGKTYVQLCHDGCVLFLDWSVEFLCDMSRPVCCVSEFSSQGRLKGDRSSARLDARATTADKGEDVEEFIGGVASFLERCHSHWLKYVDMKRQEFPELNVYTVEQLVFLQKELVKVGSQPLSKQVYPMLSLLKADCTPGDVEHALHTAMDQLSNAQQHLHNHSAQQVRENDQRMAVAGDKEAEFVQEMLNNGFESSLALLALAEVGVQNVGEGIAWCMKYEEDLHEQRAQTEDMKEGGEDGVEEREDGGGRQEVGQRLRQWITRPHTVTQSAIEWVDRIEARDQENDLSWLTKGLESVWEQFVSTVSASGSDFLSLQHLGTVLQCLAATDGRQWNRCLPPNLKSGMPNLIVCPKNAVLNAVTYMYMFPPDNNSLLPQPDEVLLCSADTSFEQVDIFVRRAFFGSQQKVYCLAFADSLDYDVGEKVDKKIKEYMGTTAGHRAYQLVVVCTTENEFRAGIVASLEKFRRPLTTLVTPKLVAEYLRFRFASRCKEMKISAADLDPEGLGVRVVRSTRSGVGKTLYKRRLEGRLPKIGDMPQAITIPLHSRTVHTCDIADCLLPHTLDPGTVLPRILHLDISYHVVEGVDELLYSLLVVGCVTDRQGQVWLRSPMDLYLVEAMPLLDQRDRQKGAVLVHQMFGILPSLTCWTPVDCVHIMRDPKSVAEYQPNDCLFDDLEFASEVFQRPYQYLHKLHAQLQKQAPTKAPLDKAHCLDILLRYCGVSNPSWSELTHFVSFLNKQLQDFEGNVFCSMATSNDLPGFADFVLRFLIQMSRDFATRSLNMSEESLSALMSNNEEADPNMQQYQLRRTWESSPHPYIFFNPDKNTMTFLGFFIDAKTGSLVDQQTGNVLEAAIMNTPLYQALILNHVPLNENFDNLPRDLRLLRLYRVLGLSDDEIFDKKGDIIDPDNTYELTTDNVKKILAIYMRFRCNIPVIVMGETGCGKTRLVKFLCSLQTPRHKETNTMVLVKVHGGTTGQDIISKVRQAEELAKKNAKCVQHRPIYTVLFFDEANTTEAVGVIKEVMCDGTLDGQPVNLTDSLKMVAACNPYRKHSDALIERLENAGLGYHVDADKTVDKLGRVPMRRLVYRVQPLPQSMLPLVWDFGQLNTAVEALYITQMVRRYVSSGDLIIEGERGVQVICNLLMESQEFMRQLKDECSFVSLRDVDRCLSVAAWFMQQAQTRGMLYDLMDDKLHPGLEEDDEEEQEGEEDGEEWTEDREVVSDMTKALVLSLGVCYRACLHSKERYDLHITSHFQYPFTIPDRDYFPRLISCCQEVFLDQVRLEDNIAQNQALKENVFMMVVCVELRIPLFLVGKPGSSKSLAKTIVADAMQGTSSYSELFKTLKQAKMVSFQCSPLATAEGIVAMFRQCAQVQREKNLDNFVSVVVLDEVGLAEDSPKMPLKTLHPLLEDGCPGEELPEACKKVGFIGISNWALDPAKMNRGILVQREVPDEDELINTARGICDTDDDLTVLNMKTLIPPLAQAYLAIFKDAKLKREFFGLRDFYSLVKMVYTFAAYSKKIPSQRQLTAAIRRNFGGLDTVDPVESFRKHLPASIWDEQPRVDDPDCSPSGLIKAALAGNDMGGDSRYLLLLTENYGGLNILSENLLAGHHAVPIFGSSFPKDQEYTQICRNINRIKVCMEMGQTVILLNLENLYESLYDALNQYYAMFGGERYVDLGLGTHRVKCRVHRQFRLIMVAEKQVVYNKFPIPLINRLEKHFLTLNNIMTDEQLHLSNMLHAWAQKFITHPNARPSGHIRARDGREETVGDVFMGYHPDTAPAIVGKVWDMLQVDHIHTPEQQEQILEECQRMLLWCATPDAMVRSQDMKWEQVYQREQQHEHLYQYLLHRLSQQPCPDIMAQVTTHSKLLTEQERVELCSSLPLSDITLLSLQAFDTEQQYCQQIRQFFSGGGAEDPKLLVVQCDSGDSNQNLIKCAQYCLQDLRPVQCTRHHVVFIVQLPSVAGGCFTGFLGGSWHCLHIDDLRVMDRPVPPLRELQSFTPAQLIKASLSHLSNHSPVKDTSPHHSGHTAVGHAREVLMGPRGDSASSYPQSSHAGTVEGGEMEVDTTDVQIEMYPDHTPTPTISSIEQLQSCPQGFDPLFLKQLFLSSIQVAVGLVRDTEQEGSLRATQRIAILIHLIEEDEAFFSGLLKLVYRLLEEREQRAFEAQQWLLREAARLDSVKKAGTFRRSWQQTLENKVVPVLAGAIAYLDTNHSLDLLCVPTPHAQPPPVWVREVWMGVLVEVCPLTYIQLCSPSGQELEEFTVRHTGAGGTAFSSQLPFSWLLWELVDAALAEARTSHGEIMQIASSVVEGSPLVRCLARCLGGSDHDHPMIEHFFRLYIMDLLLFTFPFSPAQHQMACVCVEKGLHQLDIDLVTLGMGRGLVVLHLLLEKLHSRLQAMLDLAGVRPQAVESLHAGAAGPCATLLDSVHEVTEDVALLRLVVEELQPRPNQFKEEQDCKRWVAHYTTVAPVIQRILRNSEHILMQAHIQDGEELEEEVLPYGVKCRRQFEEIRCLWTRATCVKLFFDFVGPLYRGPKRLRTVLKNVKYQLLWTLLEEDADLKKVKTLMLLDKFLKHTNMSILRGLLGPVDNCSFCKKKFESAPVQLPCKHLLCNSCYRDYSYGNQRESMCPECKSPVPANFDPSTADRHDRELVEQLGRYQQQVSGFLMAVVSQLCFAGKEPPESEAVRHIFGYITHRSKGRTLLHTKNMTVHDDLIDPTPVLRSFLLRLLLKHSENEVQSYLEQFLKNCQQLVQQVQVTVAHTQEAAIPTLLEFCLLVVHCREDLLQEQEALSGHDFCSREHLQRLTNQLHGLRHTREKERGHAHTLSSLYSLGFLRYALCACANALHATFTLTQHGAPVAVLQKDLADLVRVVHDVCRDNASDWPRKYLIKQLCRHYGLQAYSAVCSQATHYPILAWIIFEEGQAKVEEVADRFLACSPHYKVLRDAVGQLKLTSDCQELNRVIQGMPAPPEVTETLLLLALHREITMSALHKVPEEARVQMMVAVTKLIQDCDIIQDKDLAKELCENRQGGEGCAWRVRAGMGLENQSLACLFTHLQVALRPSSQHASPLLAPFRAILFQPRIMVRAYLPTMPQDNLEEILAGVPSSSYGPATLWCCPNGHRYIVGDCGRPIQVNARCNICGSRIGGTGYNQIAVNNREMDKAAADETKHGHILGPAAQRGLEAVPERQLSPVELTILRVLTHASLYLAATYPERQRAVCSLVQPPISEQEVCGFFWDHLHHDVRVLAKAVGCSTDDVYLLLHHLLHLMATLQSDGQETMLSSKQERADWERQFSNLYISPAIQNVDGLLRQGNKEIVSDDRQGCSALLNMVYETEDAGALPQNQQGLDNLENLPAAWRYRPHISVEHFFRHFHLQVESQPDMKDKFPIISLFRREYHIIQALHYVPAILAGQRQQMSQLLRRLDRAEATNLTIGDRLGRREYAGLGDLLENFSKAWDIVKEHLITYNCMSAMDGLVSLPEELFNATISRQSPLATLLPSTQGPGLCSYILLQFLLNRHNALLSAAAPLINQRYTSMPEVTVRAVMERHLVGCWPERDLLPLVVGQCNYSLMVGQAATLDYDFATFQQQLQDSFFQSKSRVQRTPLGHFPVETMLYRADTTSARLFRVLREKIEQERLSPAECRQIVEEVGEKLPDICQSIDNLNTALSFLKTLGGPPSTLLETYMTTTLRMKHTVCSQKAQQQCCLKHLQSLWLVLCHQRASILASHHQDAFDSVQHSLREEMTMNQEAEVDSMCQHMSVQCLELLLLQLFECIMLHLSEPREQDDDTQPENFRLRDVLLMNLEDPLYSTEPAEVATEHMTANHLTDFPESLQVRHATATWTLCHQHLAKKRLLLA